MELSYRLSREDGRMGGPERRESVFTRWQIHLTMVNLALSKMAELSYQSYWSRAIAKCILAKRGKESLTVMDLSNETFIMPEDIINTLLWMNVLGSKQKDEIMLNKISIRNWMQRTSTDLRSVLDDDGFVTSAEASEENGERYDEEDEE